MTRGTTLSAVSKIIVMVAGAATTLLAAAILRPTGFGQYSVCITLIFVLQTTTTFGLEHGIVYYVSAGRWGAARAFKSSQRAAVISGAFSFGAAVALRLAVPSLFHGVSFISTLLAAASLPFVLSWFYGAYLSLAVGNYEGYGLASGVQAVVALPLVVGLGVWRGVPGAVVGVLASHVLTAGLRLAPVLRTARAQPAPVEATAFPLSKAFRFGFKANAAAAMQALNLRIDMFVLNVVAPGAAVGHYALAVSATGLIAVVPGALSDILFSRAATLSSGADTKDTAKLTSAETKLLRHTTIATVVAGATCAGGLLVLVEPVFGSSFRGSIDLGLTLLPGACALAMCSVLVSAIVGRGRPDVPLRIMLVVTPLTLALYLVLIPQLHASGAAIASTASYTVTFVLVCLAYQRLTAQNPLSLMTPSVDEFRDYARLVRSVLTHRQKSE